MSPNGRHWWSGTEWVPIEPPPEGRLSGIRIVTAISLVVVLIGGVFTWQAEREQAKEERIEKIDHEDGDDYSCMRYGWCD